MSDIIQCVQDAFDFVQVSRMNLTSFTVFPEPRSEREALLLITVSAVTPRGIGSAVSEAVVSLRPGRYNRPGGRANEIHAFTSTRGQWDALINLQHHVYGCHLSSALS